MALATRAAAEAGLPDDAPFRAALTAFFEWDSRNALGQPPGVRWDWSPAGPPATPAAGAGQAPEPGEKQVTLPGPGEPVSYAGHIKPLFRERDRQSMLRAVVEGSPRIRRKTPPRPGQKATAPSPRTRTPQPSDGYPDRHSRASRAVHGVRSVTGICAMRPEKQRIQSIGNAECPYAHLLPIVEAEKSWGNRMLGDFTYSPRDDEWHAIMYHPLHLDKLREKFDFPEDIQLYVGPARPAQRPGDMYYSILDVENKIKLYYIDSHGPSLEPIARFFRRFMRRRDEK